MLEPGEIAYHALETSCPPIGQAYAKDFPKAVEFPAKAAAGQLQNQAEAQG